jgi:hypothetical protein
MNQPQWSEKMQDLPARRIQAAYEHYVDLMEEQGWSYADARDRLNSTSNKFEKAGLRQAIMVLHPQELAY